MGHVAKEKVKLLNRLKRLRGQIEAIERAVEADDECADVLQQATASRGGLAKGASAASRRPNSATPSGATAEEVSCSRPWIFRARRSA